MESLFASRVDQASSYAAARGWQRTTIPAGAFQLTAYQPRVQARVGEDPLRVYIESDGVSWLTRTQLSSDPTPDNQLVLSLAVADGGRAVYLARPCQYLTEKELAGCHAGYWSTARYAPHVIEATNIAIDALKKAAGASSVELVGYSGGGTVAVLAAASRDDVAWVATLSANLDHVLWTRDAGDSPLVYSLNAADAAPRLAGVPQIHFIALDDEKVPPKVIESYLAQVPPGAPVQAVRLPGFDHDCCWRDAWPTLLRRYAPARTPPTAQR